MARSCGKGGPPPVVDTEAAALAHVGKVVRVVGTADNAKLGAVVVHDDLTVYCWDRKDGWDTTGGPIAVEGMLEHTDELTVHKKPDGTIAAGTNGPIFVIRSCTIAR